MSSLLKIAITLQILVIFQGRSVGTRADTSYDSTCSNPQKIFTEDQNQCINTQQQYNNTAYDPTDATMSNNINKINPNDTCCNNLKLTQQNYTQCRQNLTICNNNNKIQIETIIQLNNANNIMQNNLSSSKQMQTKTKNDLTHCNHTLYELFSNYTKINTQNTDLQTEIAKLQISNHEIQQEINWLTITNQELFDANDRYIYGQFDAKIALLQTHNTDLNANIQQKNNKLQQQSDEIQQLSQRNGKYEATHSNDKQQMHVFEQQIKKQQNKINQQQQIINDLKNDNNHYLKTDKIIKTENKKLKQQINTLINGYSLHENARLTSEVSQLTAALTQCSISLKKLNFLHGNVSHDLGECNVEWGSCEMKYNMCETATIVLQKDILKQKEKFAMCTAVAKECKNAKKALKTTLKEREEELIHCTDTLEGVEEKCLIWKESKIYFYVGSGLVVFVAVMSGVVLWMFVNGLYDDIAGFKKEKKDLLSLLERVRNERDGFSAELAIKNKVVCEEKKRNNGFKETMETLEIRNKKLMKERDGLERKNKAKERQMQQLLQQLVLQQKKERQSQKINDDVKCDNVAIERGDNESNGSWFAVSNRSDSGGNNQQLQARPINKKSNK